jgi:cytoskeletal protein CcmA (bactofilin family)
MSVTTKQSPYSSTPVPGTGVATLEPAVPGTSHRTGEPVRTHGLVSRTPAWLGPGIKIQGEISGEEDLQLECQVEGPISISGHRLTVGQNAHVNGEIVASEVVVYGEATGNLLASDRIEIKKNGSVVGDLTTSRIMIEDGAYLKGAIEITRKIQPPMDLDSLLARPEKKML